jgi:hypothetical protein
MPQELNICPKFTKIGQVPKMCQNDPQVFNIQPKLQKFGYCPRLVLENKAQENGSNTIDL